MVSIFKNFTEYCLEEIPIDTMEDVTICPGEAVTLQADPTGLSYSWNADSTLTPLNSINPTATPEETTDYQVAIDFGNGCAAIDEVTVFVLPENDTIYVDSESCMDSDTGTFITLLPNPIGCDTLMIETVSLLPSDIMSISSTTCDPSEVGVFTNIYANQFGCDSTVIETVALLPSDTIPIFSTSCDPSEIGVFTQTLTNQFGCDSTVIETVALLPSDTTPVFSTSCDPSEIGVFTQTLTNQFGCDSIVIETIALLPSDTIAVFSTSCDPLEVGMFNHVLTNQFGCDSLVVETVELLPSDNVFINSNSCDPSQVGIFTNVFTNQYGCDSTVTETVSLSPSETVPIVSTTCNQAEVGIFTETFTNQYGCDSIVVETVVLLPSSFTPIFSTTCNPMEVGVFTETYVNQFGCDSIVMETVSLVLADTIPVFSTTCDPSQSGIFTEVFTNLFGCDSVVIETVSLVASDPVFVYLETCETSDTGTVTTVLPNQFGCDSIINTITTLLPPAHCNLIFTLTGDTIPCSSTMGDLTVEILIGLAPFEYVWEGTNTTLNGSGTVIGNPAILSGIPPDNYTVSITSASGIVAVQSAEILQAVPPNIHTEVISQLDCSDAPIGSAMVSISGNYPPYYVQWSTGETSTTIENLNAGVYGVTISDAYDCIVTDEIVLNEIPPVFLSTTIHDIDCLGQMEGLIIAESSGGTAPFVYSFNGADFLPENTFSGLSEGNYEIIVQDANGCEDSKTVVINAPTPLIVDLGDDLYIERCESVTISALVNVSPSSLQIVEWAGMDSMVCANCLQQLVAPIGTTTYAIQIMDDNGCTAEDSLTVFVDGDKSVYIPNAFSPNDDGINDEFYPFAKPCTVEEIRSFLVFDRWGNMVFENYHFQPSDPAAGWQGRHSGEIMDAGVFAWFAIVVYLDGEEAFFEGDVSLIR